MKYTEQAVETLDDAGSVIANKNIEIEQLRQRVAELESQLRIKEATIGKMANDAQNLTSERDALKEQMDDLLAALYVITKRPVIEAFSIAESAIASVKGES